jgi:hypothetical protein
LLLQSGSDAYLDAATFFCTPAHADQSDPGIFCRELFSVHLSPDFVRLGKICLGRLQEFAEFYRKIQK